MEVRFIFVGKKFEIDKFCGGYVNSIKQFVKSGITYIKPSTLKNEALLIKKNIKADDTVVILDEKGRLLSSQGLANLIKNTQKNMVFVVGGAFGIDKKQFKDCFFMSISNLTFPHAIARLLICEAVYRSFTIIHNLPYHKE